MKTILKTLAVVLLATAVVNCSKKKGGGGAPAPTSDLTTNARQIQYNDDGNVVTADANNIRVNGTNKCLAKNADDPLAKQKYQDISAMVASSTVGKGTLQSPGSESVYLGIRYDNGQIRRFNLRSDQASTTEDTLSKGAEIIAFFSALGDSIDQNGYKCSTVSK